MIDHIAEALGIFPFMIMFGVVVCFGAWLAKGREQAFESLKFIVFLSVFLVVVLTIYGYVTASKNQIVETNLQGHFVGVPDDTTKSELVFSRLNSVQRTMRWHGKKPPKPMEKMTINSSLEDLAGVFDNVLKNYTSEDSYLYQYGINSNTTFDMFVQDTLTIEKSKCVRPEPPCHLKGSEFEKFLTKEFKRQLELVPPENFLFDNASDASFSDQLFAFLNSNPDQIRKFEYFDGKDIASIEDATQIDVDARTQECTRKTNWCVSKLGMKY